MLLWYSDNHTSLPASEYKCQGAFLTKIGKDGSTQVAHLSSDMFKKLVKYSRFKSLDTFNLVREYVPDVELQSESIVTSSDDYSLIFSSVEVSQIFLRLAEMIKWFQSNEYNVTPVYRSSPTVDNITFSICKYSKTNSVYVNIDLVSEYVGIVRYLDPKNNLFLNEAEWFKMKSLTPESVEDTIKSKILCQLEDDTPSYLRTIEIDILDSTRLKDLFKCLNILRRGKYDVTTMERLLSDEDIESIASGCGMSKEYFYKVASSLVRAQVHCMYGEPVLAMDKLGKTIIYHNNDAGCYDYYGGLACQVED